MDSHRFDALVRSLAGSRRHALKLALGGGLTVLARQATTAAAPPFPQPPIPPGVNPPVTHGCGRGHVAFYAGGLSCCDGGCIDTQTDPHNCGGCGNDCGDGTCCQGTCVDTSSDMNNCGACGAVCTLDLCVNGRCGCDEGSEPCSGACVSCPDGGCLAAGGGCVCTCPDASCSCPAGTGCSGDAICGGYSSTGTCCSYPQRAVACHDSAPEVHDGFVTCCTWGVDCQPCPSGQYAIGGTNSLCVSPRLALGGQGECAVALCTDPASCLGIGGDVSATCA